MHAARHDRWFHRHPTLTFAVFTGCLIILLDVLAGAIFMPPAQQFLRQPHPYYHHDLVANASGKLAWGDRVYSIHTNSLGFRDRQTRTLPLETSIHRIVLMGDSFTEGIGVNYEESFAGRLDEALHSSGTEVLNAGVVGYSPRIYYLKTRYLLEEVGLRFDELHVYMDMSDIPNEIIYANYVPGRSLAAGFDRVVMRGLEKRSLLFYSLLRLVRRQSKRLNMHGVPYSNDLDNEVFDDPEFYDAGHWTENYKYAPRGLALAAANMKKLVRLCRIHGVRMTIVVYPWLINILHRELDHVQVKYWRDFARRQDVAFIDLFPAFILHDHPDKTNKKFFLEDDVHWNPSGHRWVAERILESIN